MIILPTAYNNTQNTCIHTIYIIIRSTHHHHATYIITLLLTLTLLRGATEAFAKMPTCRRLK